jgi:hypothetical protein
MKNRGVYLNGAAEIHIPPASGYTGDFTVLNSKFTFESWCRLKNAGGRRVLFGKYDVTTGNHSIEFSVDYANNKFYADFTTLRASESIEFSHTLDEKWHYVTLVMDYDSSGVVSTHGHTVRTIIDRTAGTPVSKTSRYWKDNKTDLFTIGFGYTTGKAK